MKSKNPVETRHPRPSGAERPEAGGWSRTGAEALEPPARPVDGLPLSGTGARISPMYRTRLGAIDLSTGLNFLLAAAVCYAAWLRRSCSVPPMASGHC